VVVEGTRDEFKDNMGEGGLGAVCMVGVEGLVRGNEMDNMGIGTEVCCRPLVFCKNEYYYVKIKTTFRH
jgi:hypothetical protein